MRTTRLILIAILLALPAVRADANGGVAPHGVNEHGVNDHGANESIDVLVFSRHLVIAIDAHGHALVAVSVDGVEWIMAGGVGPIQQCANLAIAVCGQGRVCSLSVGHDPWVCTFTCQDSHGDCPGTTKPGSDPPDTPHGGD